MILSQWFTKKTPGSYYTNNHIYNSFRQEQKFLHLKRKTIQEKQLDKTEKSLITS